MGQYYVCLTKNKDGQKAWDLQVVKPEGITRDNPEYFDYYNGIKLMEHSWIGNSFMTAISKYIYKNPTKVAWVGDYANDFQWEDPEDRPEPKKLWKQAWGVNQIEIEPVKEFDLKGKFLVNHTLKTALAFDNYIKESTYDGWCLHPLSLLTACGNGLGGGDFPRKCIGGYMIGDWCWNEISIEDECPEGYYVEDIIFMEAE